MCRLKCGEGNGNLLLYSCLENPMDGGAWWAAIYGVAQSWTQLKQLSSSSRQKYIMVCFKLVLEKAEEPEIKLPISTRLSKKAREFEKNIYFYFIDYAKAFHCVDHNKLWKIVKEMGIPDHLTCLLGNLCAGQEATVRTGHGKTDWFQIRKGEHQGCMLLPCLFNLYAEYIMRNAGLEEAQAGIKIAGRNINNLRYADDSTLMVESEEELKSFLMGTSLVVQWLRL